MPRLSRKVAQALLVIVSFPLLSQVPDNGTVLRSNTRLVQVDVVAEDKKGRPVTDLTRDSFSVFDQGKPQKIQVFSRNSVEPGEAAEAQQTTPRDVFTNMAEARSGPGAVTVILIDSLNTRWVNQAYARQQTIKFLSQIRPEDHLAIYSMGFGGFQVLHDFTQDTSELVTKLSTWKAEAKAQPNSDSQPDLGKQLNDWLKGRSPDYVESQHMGDAGVFGPKESLRILTSIADQLASVPGRKNLIWISEGFPLVDWTSLLDVVYDGDATKTTAARVMADPAAFQSEMATAMRKISDDNVAIYPVDALSLAEPFYAANSPTSQRIIRQDTNHDNSPVGFKTLAAVHGREQAMDEIAKRTGGKAFYESNDLMNAIRRAMDDSKTTYTLGFYPDHARFDGKFRTLKVKVTGRPDVRLRYRQGYLDSPETSGSDNDRRTRIQNAVWSPLDANGIALAVTIERKPEGGRHLRLKINSKDLLFSEKGDLRLAEADVAIVQKDEQGKLLDTIQEKALVDLTGQRYQEVMHSGIVFSRDFTLNANTSLLRIVVGDAHSERLGSVSVSRAEFSR